MSSNFERWLLSDELERPGVGGRAWLSFVVALVVAFPWWVGFWSILRWLVGLGR